MLPKSGALIVHLKEHATNPNTEGSHTCYKCPAKGGGYKAFKT